MTDPTASGVFKKEFGPYWRWWRWIARQFSVLSLGTIGGILAVGGGYIIHLGTRVVVLETRVVPVLEARKEETANQIRITDLETRMIRLEANWDNAKRESDSAPRRTR